MLLSVYIVIGKILIVIYNYRLIDGPHYYIYIKGSSLFATLCRPNTYKAHNIGYALYTPPYHGYSDHIIIIYIYIRYILS